MRKYMMIMLILTLFIISGCAFNPDIKTEIPQEKYFLGHTFDDGRIIYLAQDISYDDTDLMQAFIDGFTWNDLIAKMNYVSTADDNTSKIYKYNKKEKHYGQQDFYVLVCDNDFDKTNIYLNLYRENLAGKCLLHENDLEGVSLTIKEGSLTKTSATLVIKDESSRENIYGSAYTIEKKVDDKWEPLEVLVDNLAWTSIGYQVDENHELEMPINWKSIYGKLDKGEYRIIKSTSEAGEALEHYLTVEFTIK